MIPHVRRGRQRVGRRVGFSELLHEPRTDFGAEIQQRRIERVRRVVQFRQERLEAALEELAELDDELAQAQEVEEEEDEEEEEAPKPKRKSPAKKAASRRKTAR